MSGWFWRTLFSILICWGVASNGIASDNIKNKLNDVIQKIKSVQELLQSHHSKQVGLQKELQATELAINQLNGKIDQTHYELSEQQKIIAQLTLKQNKIMSDLNARQQTLLRQIKALYLLGLDKKQSQILLATKEPEKMDRLLTYHRYLALQSKALIGSLRGDLAALDTTKKAIQEHNLQLQQLQQNQQLQHQSMDSNKQKQQSILINLSTQVKNSSAQLSELLKNKKNLEKIIEDLQKKETYQSDYLTHHTGKFPWPTQGRVLEKFGSVIENSELRQTGILIGAPEGQKVTAVAPGKVIFASWLPGYGLLLIIDHGKNYITLYGNNNVLYKKTNDHVNDHELIAKVGHTGGRAQSALYFALRLKGKPIDPCIWCGPLPTLKK